MRKDFFHQIWQRYQQLAPSYKALIFLGVAFVFLMHFPFFILGERSYLIVHDNLENEFVYLRVLKLSGTLFANGESSIVQSVMNGIDRDYFHSEFNFFRVLFYFLPPFLAYLINSMIIRVIGVVGVVLLARDFFPAPGRSFLILLIACAFAGLPIYSVYGVTVMGQPLLLWAFLNLRDKKNITFSGSIICLFPFYSNFALVAPFALTALFFYGLYYSNLIRKKELSLYWFGFSLLTILYPLANFNIIEGFFFNQELSHREEWVRSIPSTREIFSTIRNDITYGQYHYATLNSIPILLLLLWSITIKSKNSKKALLVLGWIIAIAIFHGFYPLISAHFQDNFHLLTSFQFDRFYSLIPFLFFLIMLLLYQDRQVNAYLLSLSVIVLLGFSLFHNEEFKYNYAKLIFPKRHEHLVTYESFYSESLFKEVEDYIGRPKNEYRVVSLGIRPAIAQYNGFYTLDSYQNHYPLSYKKEFRQVIEGELEKSPMLKEYFDNWGSRCYLFSAELRKSCYLDCKKNSNIEVEELSINVEKLKELGGGYILSAVRIQNASELGISFLNVFNNQASRYSIFLYQV